MLSSSKSSISMYSLVSSHDNFFHFLFVHSVHCLEFLKVSPNGQIFPEIIDLCKVRKYCDDPYFLVPVCRPGSLVITKLSHFTHVKDFRKKLTNWKYLEKFYEASHSQVFKFPLDANKNEVEKIVMTRVTTL